MRRVQGTSGQRSGSKITMRRKQELRRGMRRMDEGITRMREGDGAEKEIWGEWGGGEKRKTVHSTAR